jgi:hypothetical protein
MLPNYKNNIERNPYIQQLTDNINLYEAIPFYINKNRKITNQDEFKKRFEIATGGAFNNVDLN